VDIGNCPKFEFKPDLKTLDHYTSRSFSMTQDAKVITLVGGKVTVVCDEITTYNLAIGVLGTTTGTVGTQVTQVLARAGFQCQIKLTQTNSVGLRHEWIFTNVLCIPDKAISIIDTKFAEIELTGDTLIDPNGSFGTVTEIA
jgi:hypothetical protein